MNIGLLYLFQVIVNELQERIDSFHTIGISTNTTNNDGDIRDDQEVPDDLQEDTSTKHHQAFEENLHRLNTEWNEAVHTIELVCVENEQTTNKWWDFARLKKKVVRWIEKKEQDARDGDCDGEEEKTSFESIVKNKDKFKVLARFYSNRSIWTK